MSHDDAILAELAASSQYCDAAERLLMTRCRIAIEVHGLSPAAVAHSIGVSRATMYRRMIRTGVRPPDDDSQK